MNHVTEAPFNYWLWVVWKSGDQIKHGVARKKQATFPQDYTWETKPFHVPNGKVEPCDTPAGWLTMTEEGFAQAGKMS